MCSRHNIAELLLKLALSTNPCWGIFDEQVSGFCWTPNEKSYSPITLKTSNIWWCPLCTRPTCLVFNFYSTSSLKQQSMSGRDSKQSSLTNYSLMLYVSREATHTNFIVFGLTWWGFQSHNLPHSREVY